jgi:hypothetical protein
LLGQGVVFAYPATPWDSGTHERERAAAPVPPQQTNLRRYGRDGRDGDGLPRSSQREQRTLDVSLILRYRYDQALRSAE